MSAENQAQIIILMGVAGCGKTTIGEMLARQLHWQFYDGDDLHPQENIDKMSQGIALNDDDRLPWLDNIRQLILRHLQADESAVITCSALKERYRQRLKQDSDTVHIVYLHGDYDLIWERMQRRHGHFMKPDMLKSQFEILEPPAAGHAQTIDINQSVDDIIRQIIAEI